MLTSTNTNLSGTGTRLGRVALVLSLAGLWLAVISLTYKNGFDLECGPPAPDWFCTFARSSVPRALGILVMLCLFFVARASVVSDLLSEPGRIRPSLGLAVIGFVTIMIPWMVLDGNSSPALVVPAILLGLLGAALCGAGLALVISRPACWAALLRRYWLALAALVVLGGALPEIADSLRTTWHSETLRTITFDAVLRVMALWGYSVDADPVDKVVGAGDFYVAIGSPCSGVEGFVLTTAFVTLYLVLFRRDLRFPAALLLLPIGVLASWMFNVLRIAILLVIGIEGNPDLAVGGFHSHAGWFMFTLVATSLIALAQGVPALKAQHTLSGHVAADPLAPPPFLQDPAVAKILPFAVFMLSALFASTLTQVPGTVYPLRVLVLGATVALFLPLYARLPWRLDGVAIGAGLAIGLMWVLIPVPESAGPAPYGALAGGLLLAWYVARGIGTVLLVPLVEELFFRDYLENRLRLGRGPAWSVCAALVTAGLFAVLHDRWVEAFIAGLVFSLVARRRGRITDAILAHAAANALVFGVAVATGNLQII